MHNCSTPRDVTDKIKLVSVHYSQSTEGNLALMLAGVGMRFILLYIYLPKIR
jgi:hypothetical protein